MKPPFPATPPGRPAAARRPRALLRGTVVVAAWVAGFLGTAWLAGRGLPARELPPLVRQKMAHLAQQGDAYDVLFLGSSRVQYHIMPSVFDQIAAERGFAVRSFNAGIAAMGPPEDAYVLDEILRRPHARLRWVVIELAALRTRIDTQMADTARVEYWHDAERFGLVTKRHWNQLGEIQKRSAKGRRKPWRKRLEAATPVLSEWARHARLFWVRFVAPGRGAALLSDHLHRVPDQPPSDIGVLGDHGDGWSRNDDAHQRMTGEVLAQYERALADRQHAPSVADRGDSVSRDALEILLAKIARAGARAILMVPPSPSKKHFVPPAEYARDLAILDFTDIEKYPTLFAVGHRQDIEHLNAAGAAVFTRLLADRFLEITRPPPPPVP